ncbi:X2-like carbohydrate binding domain-containing protein [Kribbella kalugense]|uniref:Alpha-galactosidase n=1 Tax=Kribbella kalugense TaxID=2512221 RepID=A0A4R7ZXF8_9ACTN|nr:X2-like carbohydrate binding domain-containing protein [Kribbella kalugense]TDW21831.1 carbohydrate binding protein with CBMX2 domain [Kribbella kalugense]
MTRSVRKRMSRAVLVGLAGAGLLATGLTPTSSAVPPPQKPTVQAAATPKVQTAAATDLLSGPAGDKALKPYMGWSSYSNQVYNPNGGSWITAAQLIAQSDAMHSKLQKFGYNYINIDAGWNDGVDAYGRPTPSKKLYPNGFQAVVDHIHANGQKVGLYSIPGISQALIDANLPVYGAPECKTGDLPVRPLQKADYWGIGFRLDFSKPCAQKYIDSIADLFGSWGLDFLKFDSVTPGSGVSDLSLDARDDVKAWSQALTKHKIWLELSWAVDINYADTWKQYANGWRIEWDVECYCTGVAYTSWPNINRLFPKLADWWRYAGPGGWNDLDSLDVGNGQMDGLTKDERRTAATLWAVSAAPMYIGNDMTKLDSYGLSLLTNPEVIGVNQAGRPAQPVSTKTNRQVWYSLNPDNSYTVALFNLGQTDADMTVNWSDLGLTGAAKVRDLWARKDLGQFASGFTGKDIPIHGVQLLKVTPQKGSAIRVNDDDLRVSYDGAWQRNNNFEVPAVSEPLTVAVTDSSQAKTADVGSRTMEINNDNSQIVYTGSWSQSTGRGLGDYKDDVAWTETDGDSFSYNFVGTGVDYVTETDPGQGDVDIYIDGQFKQTVSTYLDPSQGHNKPQQVVYSVSDLPNGSHTIRAVKKSGQFMLLDKLNIRQESLLNPDSATFDKGAPADVSVQIGREPGELAGISKAGQDLVKGTDYTVAGNVVTVKAAYLAAQAVGSVALDFRFRGDYRDDIHAAQANGAAVSFTFTGTGVGWSTALAPDQGNADVYIDGKLVKRVNLHGDARLTNQQVFNATGLKNAQHTLRIVKVDGDVLRNDAISYTMAK